MLCCLKGLLRKATKAPSFTFYFLASARVYAAVKTAMLGADIRIRVPVIGIVERQAGGRHGQTTTLAAYNPFT